MRSTEQEPSLFSRASSPQKSQKPAQHTWLGLGLGFGSQKPAQHTWLGLGLGLELGFVAHAAHVAVRVQEAVPTVLDQTLVGVAGRGGHTHACFRVGVRVRVRVGVGVGLPPAPLRAGPTSPTPTPTPTPPALTLTLTLALTLTLTLALTLTSGALARGANISEEGVGGRGVGGLVRLGVRRRNLGGLGSGSGSGSGSG